MGTIHVKFVRPDRQLFEGEVASLVLVTPAGELGIWPLHSPLICALGDGVVRLHATDDAAQELYVIVSGGYAEVKDDEVIILADHARRSDDIEVDVVQQTKDAAVAMRDQFAEGDHRRAYYDNKVRWCDLLLEHAQGS